MAGMGGLGHDFKAGVNFINEPTLFITFNTGQQRTTRTPTSTTTSTGRSSAVTLSNGGSATRTSR